MSAFIETSLDGYHATLVNIDAIEMVTPNRNRPEKYSIIRWRRPAELKGDEDWLDVRLFSVGNNFDTVDEPYGSLKAKILEAVEDSKERKNIPPTPPIRKKGNKKTTVPRPRARVRVSGSRQLRRLQPT